MQRLLLSVLVLLLVLVGGFYAFNAYIYAQKQGDPNDVRSYRGSLTGQVVCLPHVNTDGPTTLECALGLKTDAGEHYALDLALLSQQQTPPETGERISANGLITPVEMLSADHWRKYDIEGIFSVTDSVQKF